MKLSDVGTKIIEEIRLAQLTPNAKRERLWEYGGDIVKDIKQKSTTSPLPTELPNREEQLETFTRRAVGSSKDLRENVNKQVEALRKIFDFSTQNIQTTVKGAELAGKVASDIKETIGNTAENTTGNVREIVEDISPTPKVQAKEPEVLGEQTVGESAEKPQENYFDYASVANIPKTETIQQPPPEIGKLFFDYMPNEATQAAIVARYESHFNPQAISPVNKDGTRDYGLMQINSATFEDLKSRSVRKKQLDKIGVSTLNDLLDPEKNIQVAKIIRQEENETGKKAWSRWNGWQDWGITFNE